MFARDSRYRGVAEISRDSPDGRTLLVKDLRQRPEAPGTFRHTLAEVDRLDHLAQTYYQKPQKWWRICDANPEFPSPLALVGQDPIETIRLPVLPGGSPPPPWPELLGALRALVGVEEATLAIEVRELAAGPAEVGVVTVRFNRMNVDPASLRLATAAAGFPPGPPEPVGRRGKQITIPPEGPVRDR
jgi:hypothetical protein